MATVTDYGAQAVITDVFGLTTNMPATLYVALMTTGLSPGESAGSALAEPADGYARVAIAVGASNWAAPYGSGAVENVNDITFPAATADWGEITHWALCDAATNGNVLLWDRALDSMYVGSGQQVVVGAGSLNVRVGGVG